MSTEEIPTSKLILRMCPQKIFENPTKTSNRSKIFWSLIGEYESYYWAEFEAPPTYNVKIQLVLFQKILLSTTC